MWTRKPSLLCLIVALCFVLFAGSTHLVFADDGTIDAAININGGNLTIVPRNIVFVDVILDGTDQITDGEPDSPWSVVDATGAGDGWHVTVLFNHFYNGDKMVSVSNGALLLKIDELTTVQGNTPPAIMGSYADYSVLEPSETVILQAAPGDGMGTYQFVPRFKLLVPAETYAGQYTANVSVSVIAGP